MVILPDTRQTDRQTYKLNHHLTYNLARHYRHLTAAAAANNNNSNGKKNDEMK